MQPNSPPFFEFCILHCLLSLFLTQANGVLASSSISQPKVSLLLKGYLKSFSLERLFRFLNDLGQDIHIKIKPSTHSGHGCTMIGNSHSNLRIAALGR